MAEDFDPYYTWLGIPPKDRPPTHYRLLGLELFESNPDVIENSADRQMAHIRSFQSGPQGDVSQKLLNEITVAKLCLLNKEKKAEYDAKLRADKEAAEAAARPKTRAVRGTPLRSADPAKPFDEGEDVVQSPARLPKVSAERQSPQPASTGEAVRRRQALAPALIAGISGGVLVVAVAAFLVFRGGGHTTVEGGGSGTTTQVDPGDLEKTSLEPVEKTTSKTKGKAPKKETPKFDEPEPQRDPPIYLRLAGRDHVELAGTTETTWDAQSKEYVWLEDDAPGGAVLREGPWEWVGKPQPVFTGERSMRRTARGMKQHFFDSAKPGLTVGEGDRFFVYAYLDAANPPRNITLQFFSAESWQHRAFWGQDSIAWQGSAPASPSRRPMGELPKADQWVRLEVPAEQVGLNRGDVVTGVAFAQHDGTVYWDRFGIVSRDAPTGLTGTPLPTIANSAFTAEARVKVTSTRPRTYLMGNRAAPGQHPQVQTGEAAGWALSYARGLRDGDGPAQSGLLLEVGAKWYLAANSVMDAAWHDIALVRELEKAGTVYRVFLDGKIVNNISVPTDSYRGSPANVSLGCPPHLAAGDVTMTDVSISAMRLSHTARYKDNYTPGRSLSTDSQTFALLDFSPKTKDAIADGSGRAHHGRLVGAKWIGGVVIDDDRETPQSYVDLLRKIDFPRDASEVSGEVTLATLQCGASSDYGVLRLPHQCPREYDLELVVRRLTGEEDLTLGLVVGQRRVTLRIDADGGRTMLLDKVTGQNMGRLNTERRLVGFDRMHTIVVMVRQNGITFSTDDGQKLEWRGDASELSLPEVWARQPVGDGLFLGLRPGGFQFQRLALRPHAGGAQPQIVYLDDLQEVESKVLDGAVVGKRGDRGYANMRALFHGREPSHALSMHVPTEFAYITYDLKGQYDIFRARAAILDLPAEPDTKSPLMFKVLVDGKVRWTSHHLRRTGSAQDCAIGVAGAKTLRLEIHHDGDNGAAQAAWLYPHLSLASSSASTSKPKPKPKPSVQQPALVYLDDLQETEFKVGFGTLGKRGDRGYSGTGVPDGKVSFQGRNYPHAISTHGTPNGVSYVAYNLDGRFASFRAIAVLMDTANRQPRSAVTFKVVGDGKVLWTSTSLARADTGQSCLVDIRRVKTLRLEVHSAGEQDFQCAAWLNPAVSTNSSGIAGKSKSSRSPVPKEGELETARKRMRDLFRADIDGATTPAKKEALAKKLLSRAQQGGGQPEFTYALLDEAREAALGAGDVDSAVKVTEQLAGEFDLDGAAKLLETFNRLSAATLSAEKRKALVDAMIDAADRAAGEEEFKAAAELAALATKAATKVTDTELRRRATVVKERVDQTRVWFEEAEAARLVLAGKPDDPAANKAVGKYVCFASDDWEAGLPHLAKCDDGKLKAAALLESDSPDSAVRQALVGDAWWDLAAPATGYWKVSLQKRSQYWYQKAVGGLKDPAKGIVEKRLVTLEKTLGDSGPASSAGLAKQIVGEFFLTATLNKEKTTATLAFAADGTVSDNQLPVATWSVESNQIKIAYQDESLGTVHLRARGKDAFTGTQARPKGDSIAWDLRRVYIVAVWDVFYDRFPTASPERLVLYSNGKGTDMYGRTTWSLSGGLLTLDWPDYRGGRGLEGAFRVESGGSVFRGQDRRGFPHHGQRVSGTGKL